MTRISMRHSRRMNRIIELTLPPVCRTQMQLLVALRPSVASTAAEYRKLPLPLPPSAKRRMSVFDVFCATSSSRNAYFLSISPAPITRYRRSEFMVAGEPVKK